MIPTHMKFVLSKEDREMLARIPTVGFPSSPALYLAIFREGLLSKKFQDMVKNEEVAKARRELKTEKELRGVDQLFHQLTKQDLEKQVKQLKAENSLRQSQPRPQAAPAQPVQVAQQSSRVH